ncbi:hypothetical protein ACFC6L_22835 [Kitasatospora phosalacinea]
MTPRGGREPTRDRVRRLRPRPVVAASVFCLCKEISVIEEAVARPETLTP